MSVFRYRRIMEFCDTDMAGIVHFANFFRFMEAAEHAYLRACGLSVVTIWGGQKITFPRVSATCDDIRPARFQDELTVTVRVARIGKSSITYQMSILRGDEELAHGQIVAVLCRMGDNHALESMTFPDDLRRRIEAGPNMSDTVS